MVTKKNLKKLHTNLNKCYVENSPSFPELIFVCNRMMRSFPAGWGEFLPSKPRSCNPNVNNAFDCIVHNFLIAELEAYNFSYEILKVTENYFLRKKHKTKTKKISVILLI